jgi:hypothetical protein
MFFRIKCLCTFSDSQTLSLFRTALQNQHNQSWKYSLHVFPKWSEKNVSLASLGPHTIQPVPWFLLQNSVEMARSSRKYKKMIPFYPLVI